MFFWLVLCNKKPPRSIPLWVLVGAACIFEGMLMFVVRRGALEEFCFVHFWVRAAKSCVCVRIACFTKAGRAFEGLGGSFFCRLKRFL